MAHVQIFLSTVSAEFRSYRDALRRDLDRPNVTVKVQEDFIATGTETLDKLDEYIRQCDAVIHLVGDMTGALAQPPSVAVVGLRYPDLAARLPPLAPFLEPDAPALSYTQWEAWLALYHRKVLIIAVPQEGAPRDEGYQPDEVGRVAQRAHLAHLASVERHPEILFTSVHQLGKEVLRSKVLDILARAGAVTKPTNLPYLSIGDLFKGREAQLDALTQTLGRVPDSTATPVVATVLNGLGGVGKTRLALEYAWRRADEYTALLFVTADSGEVLQRNLAVLCAPAILNLPEEGETDEGKQRDAVLGWLRQHPGWLLILDNIDTEAAATAAEALLPQLVGGHVLLTSRLTNWSGSVAPLGLDVLSPEAAAEFLLARTEGKRRNQADDPAAARTLAEELGRLALALEQAGAHIAKERLGFVRYLALWQGQGDKVLAWLDPRLMQSSRSVAITWQTSFDQLSGPARRLLQRLAWLAPEPIPESLLDVPVPGVDAAEADLFSALAELESNSLVTRAAGTPTFSVHRLVQEVTRRSLQDEPRHGALTEALQWINAAFVGDAQDVRNWAVLDPLQPHARAAAAHADAAGITEPTARLMNHAGLLLQGKALYAEVEPLYERALAISEKALGPEHPDVAAILNNLAGLHFDRGAYAKAEPLHERALAISEKVLGPEHLDVARSLNNLAEVYHTQGIYGKAEPRHRRALSIRRKTLGPKHPAVATSLSNLAELYRKQRAYLNAEWLHKRALVIRKKALGCEHPDVATCLNNLALVYHDQGTLAKAEPLYACALTIREEALGPEHPDVATSLNNLAELYRSQGADDKAAPVYERALAISEKALGREHADVATMLNNLAQLYRKQGTYAKAEPLMRRSLAVFFGTLGAEHPSSRVVERNYTQVLRALGRTEDEINQAIASVGRRG